MPDWVAWSIFGFHSVLLTGDELLYHRRRTLKRWERIGHPLDTLTFILPAGMTLLFEPTGTATTVYIILAAFSSLFITKDEWQHHELCPAKEQWLHAVLFVIHPVSLWMLYQLWTGGGHVLQYVFVISAAGMFLHQLIYWNVIREAPAGQ